MLLAPKNKKQKKKKYNPKKDMKLCINSVNEQIGEFQKMSDPRAVSSMMMLCFENETFPCL